MKFNFNRTEIQSKIMSEIYYNKILGCGGKMVSRLGDSKHFYG